MDDVLLDQDRTVPPEAQRSAPTRPDSVRLLQWPSGADVAAGDLDVLATDPVRPDAVDVVDWIGRSRAQDPNRTLVVLEERSGQSDGGVGWRRVGEVISRLADRSAGFIGDTTPTSLSALRDWTRATLADDAVIDSVCSDIVLVVDELASNVEEHAPGWLTVDLVVADDHVLVVVSDPHPGLIPVPGQAPPDQAHGRGLFLVGALSVRWGTVVAPTAKAVWAELGRSRADSG